MNILIESLILYESILKINLYIDDTCIVLSQSALLQKHIDRLGSILS